MSYPRLITIADLNTALDKLGSSADEIAETLSAAGIKGYPEDCFHCPLANWLTSTFSLAEHGLRADVGSYEINIHNFASGEGVCTIHTSEAVADFVNDFDMGDFPNLALDTPAEEEV